MVVQHADKFLNNPYYTTMLYTIRKFFRCMADLPRFMHYTSNPRVIMTLLVKNETDIIAANLEFHHQMGVDGFIVTDNCSSDETPAILEEYKRRGWILEIIHEPATGYEQKMWVDRMVWIAKTKYKADWIINADADEFWHPTSGNVKDIVSCTRANALICDIVNVYPTEDEKWYEWENCAEPPHSLPLNPPQLHPYSIFSKHRHKVMHRADGYLQIHMGNHKVWMLPRLRETINSLVIYHYNYRGKEHFVRKMTNGYQELQAHKGKHGGRHWRYFGELLKQQSPDEIYAGVVERDQLNELTQAGYLHENPIQPLLKSIVSKLGPNLVRVTD